MIDQRGIDRDFPNLYEMAQQYDFAERLGGSDGPILEEADRALRELWMARGEKAAEGNGSSAKREALELAFSWIAPLPEGRPDDQATCAYVPCDVYDRIKATL